MHMTSSQPYWCSKPILKKFSVFFLMSEYLLNQEQKSTIYSQSRVNGMGKGVLGRIPGFPGHSWMTEKLVSAVF